jgi:hypothetical protein
MSHGYPRWIRSHTDAEAHERSLAGIAREVCTPTDTDPQNARERLTSHKPGHADTTTENVLIPRRAALCSLWGQGDGPRQAVPEAPAP